MLEDRIGFLASLGFSRMSAPEAAKTLKELGYNAVEWTLAHFNPRTMNHAALEEVVTATKDAGLSISELVIQQDYVCLAEPARRDRIALTLEGIQACGELGVSTVNLFTGPAFWDPEAPRIPRDISEGAAWDMVLDAFSEIVPALEQYGVNGAVEGVLLHLSNDYYTTRPLIDRFNSPRLGVNFDPSHDALKGNLDTGWLVRQWGKERIHHIHLKDAAGTQVEGLFLFPFLGEGCVDWRAMVQALEEIRYEGWLSIEFESFTYHDLVLKGDTIEAARRSIADAKALLSKQD